MSSQANEYAHEERCKTQLGTVIIYFYLLVIVNFSFAPFSGIKEKG